MQRDLTDAIRARDVVRVKALRSALSAIANAEAVEVATVPCGAGPAPTEIARHHLSDADIRTIIDGEIDEVRRSAAELRLLGQPAAAADLDARAACLEPYLG